MFKNPSTLDLLIKSINKPLSSFDLNHEVDIEPVQVLLSIIPTHTDEESSNVIIFNKRVESSNSKRNLNQDFRWSLFNINDENVTETV